MEEALAKTFVTPIDREDLQQLSSELDTVLDLTNGAIRACTMLGVEKPTEPMKAARRRSSSTAPHRIDGGMPKLRRHEYGEIVACTARAAQDREGGGHRLPRGHLALFQDSAVDAKMLIREKTVLEDLENAIDQCDSIAGHPRQPGREEWLVCSSASSSRRSSSTTSTASTTPPTPSPPSSRRACCPIRTAVIIAGVLNFVGAVTGTAVAKTIASGFADSGHRHPERRARGADRRVHLEPDHVVVRHPVELVARAHRRPRGRRRRARRACPRSSGRALYEKVLIPLVASPLIGFASAFILMIALFWVVRRSPAQGGQPAARGACSCSRPA